MPKRQSKKSRKSNKRKIAEEKLIRSSDDEQGDGENGERKSQERKEAEEEPINICFGKIGFAFTRKPSTSPILLFYTKIRRKPPSLVPEHVIGGQRGFSRTSPHV